MAVQPIWAPSGYEVAGNFRGTQVERCLQGLAGVAERRGEQQQAMEYLNRAGELFSRYGAKLYLDHVLAKKGILKA